MSSNSGWSAPSTENAPDPLTPGTPANLSAPPAEDPPFGGLEVLQIGLLMFVAPIIAAPFVVVLVQKFRYPHLSFMQVGTKPWVLLAPQFIWFAVVALFLLDYTKWKFHQTLWQTIRWNWPAHRWPVLVGIGFLTLIALQGLERLLPLLRRTFASFPRPERRQMGERVRHGGARAEGRAFDAENFDPERAAAVLPIVARLLGPERRRSRDAADPG